MSTRSSMSNKPIPYLFLMTYVVVDKSLCSMPIGLNTLADEYLRQNLKSTKTKTLYSLQNRTKPLWPATCGGKHGSVTILTRHDLIWMAGDSRAAQTVPPQHAGLRVRLQSCVSAMSSLSLTRAAESLCSTPCTHWPPLVVQTRGHRGCVVCIPGLGSGCRAT